MKKKIFKVGDKVKLVKHGKISWELIEWTKEAGLELQQIYEVAELATAGWVKLNSETHGWLFHPNHFTKVRGKK